MNEIILDINRKIYRLTNRNNGEKFDRAVKDAGTGANSSKILAHYDKYLGYIQDGNGNKVQNGQFWEAEKVGSVKGKIRKEKLKEIIKYAAMAGKYFFIPLMVAYFIYKFGWNK